MSKNDKKIKGKARSRPKNTSRSPVDLSRLQKARHKIGKKVLVIFEGRDASGKDGTINDRRASGPRETRVVALAHHLTAIRSPGISRLGAAFTGERGNRSVQSQLV